QFDENYLARQREKELEKQQSHYQPQKIRPSSSTSSSASHDAPPPAQKNTDSNGRITQEVREYRKKNNLCMFDGGNHKTHLCKNLIEKCLKEGKPLPVDPSTYQVPTTPFTANFLKLPLTIASLNPTKAVEVEGYLGGLKTKFLVDGASHVNACIPRIMRQIPSYNKKFLKKPILTFNGEIAVDASDAYESSLFIEVPGLSTGQAKFVEAPIKTYTAILGLPWLETVNPDINWINKTVKPRIAEKEQPTNPVTRK
ncbi:hypothetical protein K3495_g16668, partial [Podosphaera aphanis]